MSAIKATWKNGQIIPDEKVDWPDGCRLTVVSEPQGSTFLTEDEQGDDPATVARWLAEFDALPPLRMTPEEEAQWQKDRKAQKEFEQATFSERAEKLGKHLS